MERFDDMQIENAESMSEMERLEAMFKKITNSAIQHLQNDLAVAQAMGDEDAKKVYHIQISMFRHAQGIFHVARRYATDKRWKDGNTTNQHG